jgi:hypothetical protein
VKVKVKKFSEFSILLCEDWRKKGGKGKIINKREKKERKKKVGF